MKSNFFLFSIIAMALLTLPSCTGKMITEADNGKTFEYAIGSGFQVQLEGQPEQGFMWKVVGVNNSVVIKKGEPVIQSLQETGKDYGTYTFTFETKSAGNTSLKMIYYDKNAEDPKPENEFEIRITSGTMGRIEE